MKSIAMICLMVLAASRAGISAEWPQYLGPDRDGVSAEKNLLSEWPKAGPPVLWTTDVGPGGGTAIRDGSAFLICRTVGGADVLRVLDVMTGKPQWECTLPVQMPASLDPGCGVPTVDIEVVYVQDASGGVSCVNRSTQKILWTAAPTEA
jgi:outer membrane protein assembly factor BamB